LPQGWDSMCWAFLCLFAGLQVLSWLIFLRCEVQHVSCQFPAVCCTPTSANTWYGCSYDAVIIWAHTSQQVTPGQGMSLRKCSKQGYWACLSAHCCGSFSNLAHWGIWLAVCWANVGAACQAKTAVGWVGWCSIATHQGKCLFQPDNQSSQKSAICWPARRVYVGVGGVGGVVLLPCAQVAAASFIRPTSQAKGVCWQPPVAPAQSLRFEGTRAAPPRSLRIPLATPASSPSRQVGTCLASSASFPAHKAARKAACRPFGVLATPLSCLLCCVLTTPPDPPGPSPSVRLIIVGIKCELSCTQASLSCAQGRLLTRTVFLGVLATPLSCRLLCCVLAMPLPPGALAAGLGAPLSPAQSWRDSSCWADSPPLPLTSCSFPRTFESPLHLRP
jgi:hypothetical protein